MNPVDIRWARKASGGAAVLDEEFCVIALRDREGRYSLFVELFDSDTSPPFLRHTTNPVQAKRYERSEAVAVLKTLETRFHLNGKVIAA